MEGKARILVVDDDEKSRRSLTLIFEKSGYKTESAANGLEAVEKAREKFFNAVLLDIRLPDMEGVNLIAPLKDIHPETAVVMVTGHATVQNAIQALNEGASAYITKPLNMAEVLARIREVLGKQLSVREEIELHEATRKELEERKSAEASLNEMLERIEKSHYDMLSILTELNIATVITDERGLVKFLNRKGQNVLGKRKPGAGEMHWMDLFPFRSGERSALKAMSERRPDRRTSVPVHMKGPGGVDWLLEAFVHDDPRNPEKKIFYFYGPFEIYDLGERKTGETQFQGLVGRSAAMRRIFQQIRDVSDVDWTVLIEGETGSGKELVARAIHFSGRRGKRPFIAVNCAVLPDSLLASQLFGHVRGAFTGAVSDYKGMFETASGGTIFLDEIGDMPFNLQSALLRTIEEKEITRLGESTPRKIDVRIIVATHRDLNEAVARETFRKDLLYRIRVARIRIPPLRERREDIPLLVASFLEKCRAATARGAHEVSERAMHLLMNYHWPGNVRELRSAIESATTHCRKSVIDVGDLPEEIARPTAAQAPSSGEGEDERKRVLEALEIAGGKRTLAARLLGMSRATLYRRLAKLDI